MNSRLSKFTAKSDAYPWRKGGSQPPPPLGLAYAIQGSWYDSSPGKLSYVLWGNIAHVLMSKLRENEAKPKKMFEASK